MGCDIHIVMAVTLKEGQVRTRWLGDDSSPRCYPLFAELAGVRGDPSTDATITYRGTWSGIEDEIKGSSMEHSMTWYTESELDRLCAALQKHYRASASGVHDETVRAFTIEAIEHLLVQAEEFRQNFRDAIGETVIQLGFDS